MINMEEGMEQVTEQKATKKMTFEIPKRYIYVGVVLLVWILGLAVYVARRNALASFNATQDAVGFDIGIVSEFKAVFEEFGQGPYISVLRKGSIASGQYEHKMIWAGSKVGGGYAGVMQKIGDTKNEIATMTVNSDKMFIALFVPTFVSKENMKVTVEVEVKKNDEVKHSSVEVMLKKGYGIAGLRIEQGSSVALQAIRYMEVAKTSPTDLVKFSPDLPLPKGVNYDVPLQ